jgi:hypothetical protein
MGDSWLDEFIESEQAPAPAPAAHEAAPPAPPAASPAAPTPAVDDPAAAAIAEIKQIHSDPSHPLHPSHRRGDAGKRAQWDRLYRLAYGVGDDATHVVPAGEEFAASAAPQAEGGAPTLTRVLEAVAPPAEGWTPYQPALAQYLVPAVSRLAASPTEAAATALGALTILRRAGVFSPDGPVVPPAPGSADRELEREYGGAEGFEQRLQLVASVMRRALPDAGERRTVIEFLEARGLLDSPDFLRWLIRTAERAEAQPQ